MPRLGRDVFKIYEKELSHNVYGLEISRNHFYSSPQQELHFAAADRVTV
jgi:hypothetical protein